MYEYIFMYYVKLDLIILDQITNNTPHTHIVHRAFIKKIDFYLQIYRIFINKK